MIRELVIISIILFILIGFVYKVPIQLSARYDPPSIYNFGGGGYSVLYNSLERSGYSVYVIYSTDQLYKYDPGKSVLILASPDKSLSEDDVKRIIDWISAGGYVLALDEIGTLNILAQKIGSEIGIMVPEVVSGECVYNGKIYKILFNKYSPIKIYNLSDPSIVGYCYTKDLFVGLFKRVGSGVIFLIGDSSLFINNLLRTKYYVDNLLFLKDVVGDRSIIFYEGGREYIVINTEAFFNLFGWVMTYLSMALTSLFHRDPVLSMFLISSLTAIGSLYYLKDYIGVERVSPTTRLSLYRVDRSILTRRYEKWVLRKK